MISYHEPSSRDLVWGINMDYRTGLDKDCLQSQFSMYVEPLWGVVACYCCFGFPAKHLHGPLKVAVWNPSGVNLI